MQGLVRALVLGCVAFVAAFACGDGVASDAGVVRVPTGLAVRTTQPPRGVEDLKFAKLFRLPVGPRGLEPTDRLRGLDGKRVRIVAYMVRRESPDTGGFLIAPFPLAIDDDDESLADNLPPNALFVRVDRASTATLPWIPGLMQFTGTLHVGAAELAPSGRIVPAQLVLDARPARALLRLSAASRDRRRAR